MSGGAHLRFAFRGPPTHAGGQTPALAREFVAFGSGEAWRRSCAELEAAGPATRMDVDWDILFQIGRSTFRPRGAAYDPVQQLLVDIRPSPAMT